MADVETRNYHLVKIYHSLEKSMSYKNRNPDHGWNAAFLLLGILKESRDYARGFHDDIAIKILRDFLNFNSNIKTEQGKKLETEMVSMFSSCESRGTSSVKNVSSDMFYKGMLEDPELFFFSRYTLREFAPQSIDTKVVERAIGLALKTPSVCNRQPWHFYISSDRKVIDKALSIQSGNRGFGHAIPNLMIVTSDLKAFMSGSEHYQHWIDGGLVSMSVIYALHSLGLASCCLNWSQTPSADLKLRRMLNIKGNHTVLMMLAFGFPEKDNIVCASRRRPLDQFMSELKEQ